MIFSMSESDWDAVMAVHLKGTFAPPITPLPGGASS